MFDFEKLTVYQTAKSFNHTISKFLAETKYLDKSAKDQLKRAALSIVLNIAEGTGRFSKRDRRNFYVIARGPAFECAAIFDLLKSEKTIDASICQQFYSMCEEISKILFTMIKKLD